MRVTNNSTILGAVSGDERFQNANAQSGIQQNKNPEATYDNVRLILISFTEILPEQLLLFLIDGTA